MNDITINKIVIHSKGDESVGLFSATWTIDGPINVDPDDIGQFRQRLVEAWEFIADDATVTFEVNGTCCNCGKLAETIQPPDPYSGWCFDCAKSDAMADSDVYDYRTAQIDDRGY